MELLKANEMMQISGGAIKTGVLVAVVGIVVFIVGVIDGYFRPYKCNK